MIELTPVLFPCHFIYPIHLSVSPGMEANVMRAMVLNGTKMACYDQISLTVKKSGMVPAGIATQFISAFGAGFFICDRAMR